MTVRSQFSRIIETGLRNSPNMRQRKDALYFKKRFNTAMHLSCKDNCAEVSAQCKPVV